MKASFQPTRMKRKDFDDVDDDCSDFPLSSPATKIRRLDAELPPMVIVDEEPEVATVAFDQPPEQSFHNSGCKIEELPNEERAIVLYSPSIGNTTSIVHSPSNFSVSLHPQFISELRNQLLRPDQSNTWRLANDDNEDDRCSSSSGNGCQAVVPWTPPRFPSADGDRVASQIDCSEITEMMDNEEMGEAAMDVDDSVGIQHTNANESPTQCLPQWQPQPHCTVVQPPHNTTTPIVWYR